MESFGPVLGIIGMVGVIFPNLFITAYIYILLFIVIDLIDHIHFIVYCY